MKTILSKRFERVLSIVIVALFAGVAMFFNGGRLAYFGHHPPNPLTHMASVPATSTIYAENRWKGESIWTPVAFAADGTLTFKDFVDQMFNRTFATELREGSADLPHYVHVLARHHSTPAPTGLEYRGKTYKTTAEAQAAWLEEGPIFLDHWGHNLRVNSGINWQYGQMAGGTAAVCTYIALTNTAITPAATDTALSGEITANGLSRALGTVTHTSNATSYTLANTFTATGTQAAQAAAILNASSSGTMCFENTFTQASLVSGDTLTVTWTIAL